MSEQAFRVAVANALRQIAWAVEHTHSEERFWQVARRAIGSITSAVDKRYPSRRSAGRIPEAQEIVTGD